MTYLESRYLPSEYAELENYLIGEFGDPPNIPDIEIAKLSAREHIRLNLLLGIHNVIRQGRDYLKDEKFKFEALANASNRNLLSEQDARNWLEMVLSTIEENLPKDDASSPMH